MRVSIRYEGCASFIGGNIPGKPWFQNNHGSAVTVRYEWHWRVNGKEPISWTIAPTFNLATGKHYGPQVVYSCSGRLTDEVAYGVRVQDNNGTYGPTSWSGFFTCT